MVITPLPALGIKCQVGDFSVLVDAPPSKKGGLNLRTETIFPVNSFEDLETIHGPGEYEIEGVRIKGVALPEESTPKAIKTAYKVELDGIHLGFLGKLETIPKDKPLDLLGEIDILFVSINPKKINGKQLITLIKQISPHIVIPTDEAAAKLLAQEMGQKARSEEKFVVKRKDLDKEESTNKLVWLKTK